MQWRRGPRDFATARQLRFAVSIAAAGAACLVFAAAPAFAHEIGGRDAAFVAATQGPAPGAFVYLGAKHMVTGYDHLLFLAGVVFLLRQLRDVVLYVSLFSLGHSVTLVAGALLGLGLNAYLVDAVIGLSVVYKAFDNLKGFELTLGWRPDPLWMVFGFGLVHGLGLATKLEELRMNSDGLVTKLLSFNLGVEVGQVLALSLVLGVFALWRRTPAFERMATGANGAIMAAGFVLIGYQLASYWWGTAL